jgi:hypothetical protein
MPGNLPFSRKQAAVGLLQFDHAFADAGNFGHKKLEPSPASKRHCERSEAIHLT